MNVSSSIETTPKPDPVTRSWGWRILKGFGCGCGTLLLALFAVGLYGAWRYRTWVAENLAYVEQELARIKAAGEPMTVDELYEWHRAPEGEVDQTNEWVDALAEMEAVYARWPKEVCGAIQEFGPSRYHDRSTPIPPTVLAFLEDAAPAIERFVRLAETEKSVARFPHAFEENLRLRLVSAPQLRGAMYAMRASARAHVQQGELDVARRRLTAAIEMAATLETSPTLVEHMVFLAATALACQAIEDAASAGALDDHDLRHFAERLARFDFAQSQRTALIGERGVANLVMTTPGELARINLNPGEIENPKTAHAVAGPIDRATYLCWMSRLIALTSSPYAETKEQLSLASEECSALLKNRFEAIHNIYTSLLIPALDRTFDARFVATARTRITRVGLHALIYRRQTGRWPESCDELGFAEGDPAPIDPFTDQPLKLVETPEGLKVYSVGKNLVDDGGSDREGTGIPDVAAVFRFAESTNAAPSIAD